MSDGTVGNHGAATVGNRRAAWGLSSCATHSADRERTHSAAEAADARRRGTLAEAERSFTQAYGKLQKVNSLQSAWAAVHLTIICMATQRGGEALHWAVNAHDRTTEAVELLAAQMKDKADLRVGRLRLNSDDASAIVLMGGGAGVGLGAAMAGVTIASGGLALPIVGAAFGAVFFAAEGMEKFRKRQLRKGTALRRRGRASNRLQRAVRHHLPRVCPVTGLGDLRGRPGANLARRGSYGSLRRKPRPTDALCDLGFVYGAGDGNRTRMTSLEERRPWLAGAADLRVRDGWDTRCCPLLTALNGPLMAQARGRSCSSNRVQKTSWFGLTGCLLAIVVSS